jgi:hypothetical protein
MHYIQGLCQSGLSTAIYALLIVVYAAMVVQGTWTVVQVTAANNSIFRL